MDIKKKNKCEICHTPYNIIHKCNNPLLLKFRDSINIKLLVILFSITICGLSIICYNKFNGYNWNNISIFSICNGVRIFTILNIIFITIYLQYYPDLHMLYSIDYDYISVYKISYTLLTDTLKRIMNHYIHYEYDIISNSHKL